MELPSIGDALSLADTYGIGWLFAIGEAIILIIIGRWLAIGKLRPGSTVEKIEKQRDEAMEKALSAIDALERSIKVMENMKPAERSTNNDKDGGG